MLSQEVCEAILLDHYRNPRHLGNCEGGASASVENPSCGDQIRLSLQINKLGHISCVRFTGAGCAASQAGASLVLSQLEGQPWQDAVDWLVAFSKQIESGTADPVSGYDRFQEAAALFVFSRIPARQRCATLAAKLLQAMLGAVEKT
jgi:nitrogen fixation NifU-like protein